MRNIAALVIVLLILAGCTAPSITSSTEVDAESGVVVLRLANNVNTSVAGNFSGYELVKISSDGGSYSLYRQTPGVVNSSVFAGVLAPGKYYLSQFATEGPTFRRDLNVPKVFGTFTVRSGQLTDLGTLIVKPVIDNKFLFAQTANEVETRELVSAVFPKVANAMLVRPILGWDENNSIENLRRGFVAMRSHVAPINSPIVTPSGVVYAGSALGQVLQRRSGATTWSQLDTGTTREILVAIEDGQAIIAGGEEGFLSRSVDGGRSWRRLNAPNAGAILHLVRRPNAGLMLISLFEQTITAWELVDEIWHTRGKFPFEPSSNLRNIIAPYVVSGPGHIFVGMPNGVINVFDFMSGKWRRHEAPFSLWSLSKAGESLYAHGAKFLNSIWLSENNAQTWRELVGSNRIGTPVFSDSRTGYVIYITETDGKWVLKMTKDGGATWAEGGELPSAIQSRPVFFRPMILHPAGPTLLIFGGNGAVFSTRDFGKTWTEERRGAF